MNPDIVWAVILTIGLGYEFFGVFNKTEGDTLSERLRAWFRIKTSKPGRALFTVAFGGFAIWFIPHILLGIV